MPTVAKNNEVITVIVIFTVEPERQQELIDTIISFSDTVKQQAGFVSASLHKSLDGVKVANYAQWKSQEDYEAFVNNNDVQALGAKLSKFPRPDSHVYEVVISKSKVGIPKISKGGFLTYFAEFRMKPENQQRMVDLVKEEVVITMQQPGLISANFHRSQDGTRVINYGQWRDQAAIEELQKQPGFGSESLYWEGIAENEFHLYEVVFTEPAD
ncbi:MAG: antibiotic biosynthesis monooxygenase family protein [Nostoc sp.]|uniref:antibiotic biosynthesis monooxygenase family protein n=1 Tax=Nostoc sp. TaxID=1180 RepID=UPI002FFA4E12